MKNIHILPTPNPSRLLYFGTSKELTLQVNLATFRTFERSPQNIYITNDLEIKEGDWVIKISSIYKGGGIAQKYSFIDAQFEDIIFKKIILTTDTDLIKDGVQAIDDEFLEWFVKNPSCERVETIKVPYFDESGYSYLSIIPKEEPKKELKVGDNTNFGIITDIKEYSVCFGKNKVGVDIWYKKLDVKLVPKQETVEQGIDFEKELSKWGYNKGNSIDVEILVNEILPDLFKQFNK
jgi:hypothetical protein